MSDLIYPCFSKISREKPNSLAILTGGRGIPYSVLTQEVDLLASKLEAAGVAEGQCVAVELPRSVELVVSYLAILKIGAVFVPLDSSLPKKRKELIVESAGVVCIITSEGGVFSDVGQRYLISSEQSGEFDFFLVNSRGDLEASKFKLPNDSCYVMFTSGSTGLAKGVVGSQSGTMNRLRWMWRKYPYENDDVCMMKTPIGFVDSIGEIFGPLLVGVPIVILGESAMMIPDEFCSVLILERITRLVVVPTFLNFLLEELSLLEKGDHCLRLVVCSGEELKKETVLRFREVIPTTRLLNLYGSTEVSADIFYYETERLREEDRRVPIGAILPQNDFRIVQDQSNGPEVLQAGVRWGELWVSGKNLAVGYLEVRQSKGVSKGVCPNFRSIGRDFATGDIVEERSDGNLNWLGRKDNQIKMGGVRVGLEEIESYIGMHPSVDSAAVCKRKIGDIEDLWACVLFKHSPLEAKSFDLSFLGENLPKWAIPCGWSNVDHFVLNDNGKVDRSKTLENCLLNSGSSLPFDKDNIEESLCAIWRHVLGLDRVRKSDNFITLGGTSLSAIAAVSEGVRIGLRVNLSSLLRGVSISDIAREIRKRTRFEDDYSKASILCSPQQTQLFQRYLKDEVNRHVLVSHFEITTRVTLSDISEAIYRLVGGHSVLRAPIQCGSGCVDRLPLPVENLDFICIREIGSVGAKLRSQFLEEQVSMLVDKIRVDDGNVVKFGVLVDGEDPQSLLMVISHFVADDVTMSILKGDLEYILRNVVEKNRVGTKSIKVPTMADYVRSLQKIGSGGLSSMLIRFNQARGGGQVGHPGGDRRGVVVCERLDLDLGDVVWGDFCGADFRLHISSFLMGALGAWKKMVYSEAVSVFRVVDHNRGARFKEGDFSSTIGLLRLHCPVILDLSDSNVILECSEAAKKAFTIQRSEAERFYLHAYCHGGGELSKELRKVYDSADFQLNILAPKLLESPDAFLKDLPVPSFSDATKKVDRTIRVYVNQTREGVSINIYYFKDCHKGEEIRHLVDFLGSGELTA